LPNLPWKRIDLGKPFWRATENELRGDPAAKVVYVFKSFGDTHTSVPVLPHESERAGRFVRSANTECGIHTRAARPGHPYGGRLVDREVKTKEESDALLKKTQYSVNLTERQSCDVELLINGAFSPLEGFMTKEEYDSVVETSRLPEQQLWSMPVVLDVNPDDKVKVGAYIALKYNGKDVAVLQVTSVWTPDKTKEANAVFGTTSLEHPGVADLALNRGSIYVGGPIFGLNGVRIERPYASASPREIRAKLPRGGASVIAFQCRNPIHRAHWELVARALKENKDAVVLLHPTVGPTQPGDIDGLTRVATYEALAKELNEPRVVWAYLPLSMRMAGPREAIHHMIVRKNFGATHFIVGRDMAGTKGSLKGGVCIR
jgi:sulfate adenylyltransferase